MSPSMIPGSAAESIHPERLAFIATSKLDYEGRRPDHRLRYLVLTANLIDDLAAKLLTAQLEDDCVIDALDRDTADWTECVTEDLAALNADQTTEQEESETSDGSDSDAESDFSDGSEEAITPPPLTKEQVFESIDLKGPETGILREGEDCMFELDDMAEMLLGRYAPLLLSCDRLTGVEISVAVVEGEDDIAP